MHVSEYLGSSRYGFMVFQYDIEYLSCASFTLKLIEICLDYLQYAIHMISANKVPLKSVSTPNALISHNNAYHHMQ